MDRDLDFALTAAELTHLARQPGVAVAKDLPNAVADYDRRFKAVFFPAPPKPKMGWAGFADALAKECYTYGRGEAQSDYFEYGTFYDRVVMPAGQTKIFDTFFSRFERDYPEQVAHLRHLSTYLKQTLGPDTGFDLRIQNHENSEIMRLTNGQLSWHTDIPMQAIKNGKWQRRRLKPDQMLSLSVPLYNGETWLALPSSTKYDRQYRKFGIMHHPDEADILSGKGELAVVFDGTTMPHAPAYLPPGQTRLVLTAYSLRNGASIS